MKTLNDLLKEGNSDYALNRAKYLIIVVKVEGNPSPEIIINHKANFESKLSYYAQAYNDDLTLKANPKIKITDFEFTNEITLN